MYLRTPKRYTKRGQRRRFISLKWIWLWILAPVVIFIGVGIYQNRGRFQPQVSAFIDSLWRSAGNTLSTVTAPTPMPTQDPTERIARANTFWTQGSIEQALQLYQEVLPAVPNDVLVHYRVALGLIIEGRYADALAAAERTVTANPFSSDAWAIRAWALEWNGEYGAGIASALQALEFDPENARAKAFLAELYHDVGQSDRALDTVNQAIELDPNSFEAYRVRGRIMEERLYDLKSARADYQKSYDLAPNMVYPAIALALIDAAQGDTETAINTLRSIADLNPQNTQALYWLGHFAFVNLGDFNRASDYLTRCVQADPRNILCYYRLGRAQISLEQYEDAAESFKTAIDLGSTDPRHYWWAARAQINLGNCTAAISYLRPGFALAEQRADSNLISDYGVLARECQFSLGPSVQPTETPTLVPEPTLEDE